MADVARLFPSNHLHFILFYFKGQARLSYKNNVTFYSKYGFLFPFDFVIKYDPDMLTKMHIMDFTSYLFNLNKQRLDARIHGCSLTSLVFCVLQDPSDHHHKLLPWQAFGE